MSPRGHRSRIRSRLDVGRLREAASGPGADPRSWIAFGRVDDDDDAVRWDGELGWIADVTIVGGPLDGEGPVAVRIAGSFVAPFEGGSVPVIAPALLVLVLPEGDLNAGPIAIGALWTPDVSAPTSVGGEDVDEEFNDATWWLSVARDVVIESQGKTAKLLGQNLYLAEPEADQPFVLGRKQYDALKAFLDATDTFVTSISTATPAPPNAALTVANVLTAANVYKPAIAEAKSALEQALSERIKGA